MILTKVQMCILLMNVSHQPAILTHRQAKNCLILFYINTNFTSIYRYPTYYQNNPSCIDHIVTNSPKSFFKTETVFTGISDFHELFLSVFRLHFSKAKAKEISYRSFRDFKEDNWEDNRHFQNRLSAESVEEYAPFEKVFVDVLNKHAPLKKKVVRA